MVLAMVVGVWALTRDDAAATPPTADQRRALGEPATDGDPSAKDEPLAAGPGRQPGRPRGDSTATGAEPPGQDLGGKPVA